MAEVGTGVLLVLKSGRWLAPENCISKGCGSGAISEHHRPPPGRLSLARKRPRSPRCQDQTSSSSSSQPPGGETEARGDISGAPRLALGPMGTVPSPPARTPLTFGYRAINNGATALLLPLSCPHTSSRGL